MENKLSQFLTDAKECLVKTVDLLSKDFDYVSILATDTDSTNYMVSKSITRVGEGMDSERGFVARVYNNDYYGEVSFDKLQSPEDLSKMIKKEITENYKFYKENNFSMRKYSLIDEEEFVKDFSSDLELSLDEMSVQEKINYLTEIKDKMLKESNLVVSARAMYIETEVRKLFVSKKMCLNQAYTFTSVMAEADVQKDDDFRYDYKSVSRLGGLEVLKELDKIYKEVVHNAIELLGSELVKPGYYDLISAPDITGLLAHEAFGHGVEMDMFVKDRALAKDYVNKRVASDITTMHDGATAIGECSSYSFDDEGTLASDTVIIENGILRRGMADKLSAMSLGVKPTGNGKRESFRRKAYTRMTNTFFEGGKDSVDDMIKSIDYGFLLDGMNNGMEDPKNWGIQCTAMKAREIKDGKLTGKVFSPATLTGYVPDVLESISMISGEIEMNGSGYCGKGYKEWVKTSTGGSYLKFKGRLS